MNVLATPAQRPVTPLRRDATDPGHAHVLYGLAAALILVTTLTPLVRFGDGRVTVSLRDMAIAVASLAAWVPVVVAVARLVRQQDELRPGLAWAAHVLFGVLGLLMHTAVVILVDAWLSGRTITIDVMTGGPAGIVLAALGAFQYVTLLALLFAMRAVGVARRTREEAAALEVERAHLQAELDRARVGALRARLQPHFLFNTLNSILVLTLENPVGAQAMIRQLSELLRAAIADDGTTTIPLRRELELVDAYLAIQRVRFADRLRVTQDVDASLHESAVPPFLLQPLVENAIHHAVAPRESGGALCITATRQADRLTIIVRDDGPGCEPDDSGARGLGLQGSKARLAHAYGSDATLALARGASGGCEVRLDLPLVQKGT